jgi:hypothetical protein
MENILLLTQDAVFLGAVGANQFLLDRRFLEQGRRTQSSLA